MRFVKMLLFAMVLPVTLSGCTVTTQGGQMDINLPFLEKLGVGRGAERTLVVTNATGLPCELVAMNKLVGRFGPGQTLSGKKGLEFLGRTELPLVVRCYSSPSYTAIVGIASEVVRFQQNRYGGESWVVDRLVWLEGVDVSKLANFPSRAGSAEIKLPRIKANGTAVAQIVNSSAEDLSITNNGRLEGDVPPGGIYYSETHVPGSRGNYRMVVVATGSRGTKEYRIQVPSRQVRAYQKIY